MYELFLLNAHEHILFTGPVIVPATGPVTGLEAAAAPAAGLAATIAVAAATAGTRVAAGAGAGPAAETEVRARTQPDRRLEKRKEEFRFKTEIAPFVHIRLPFELQFNNCITF